ncbi:toxin biosynthesis protein [Phaeosphaeriaceae sp. PMI808]|nr:toxin biosynthesis protein [Phaeosphaeriaceae sp. PMI808]
MDGAPEDNDFKLNFIYTPNDGSIVPHILLFLVQMAALSSPMFSGRKVLFSTLIVGLAIAANFNRFTSDPGLAQFFSLAWPHYLSVLEKIVFAAPPGPEASLWRVDRPAHEALSMKSFGISKLVWAWVIWFNLRGIRWNFQVKNIPEGPPPGQSRWAFVTKQLFAFVRLLLMADFFSRLGRLNFYTAVDGSVGSINSRYLTSRHPKFSCQLYRTATMGIIPYTFMNLQYVGGAVLWVALGISKAEDWPPFFGRLAQVTRVRAFWGKFWHQMIRRTVNAWTGALVDGLQLRDGLIRTYTQLWSSFAISGVMHAASIYLIPSPMNIPFYERSIGFFQFFILQAAAITLEDFVLYLWESAFGKAQGHRLWHRVVGYTWVIYWFAFSLPYFLDNILKLKNFEEPMLPFTVMEALVPYASFCSASSEQPL